MFLRSSIFGTYLWTRCAWGCVCPSVRYIFRIGIQTSTFPELCKASNHTDCHVGQLERCKGPSTSFSTVNSAASHFVTPKSGGVHRRASLGIKHLSSEILASVARCQISLRSKSCIVQRWAQPSLLIIVLRTYMRLLLCTEFVAVDYNKELHASCHGRWN